jgi:hypothetical protein
MRILLDHCVDVRFSKCIPGHTVDHTKHLDWERLTNGELLDAAEREAYEVFVTVDKSLRHQQNLAKRRIVVITLNSPLTGLDDIQPLAPSLQIC